MENHGASENILFLCNMNSLEIGSFENVEKTGAERSWRIVLIVENVEYGIKRFQKAWNGISVIWDPLNFETLDLWKFENMKMETFKSWQFQLKDFSIKGIPLPLNIPTPTPAPAPLLGDTRELGGHEWSVHEGTWGTRWEIGIINATLLLTTYINLLIGRINRLI